MGTQFSPMQVKAQFDWIILSSDGMPPPQSFKAFLLPTVAQSLQMGTSGSASSTMSNQWQGMLAFCAFVQCQPNQPTCTEFANKRPEAVVRIHDLQRVLFWASQVEVPILLLLLHFMGALGQSMDSKPPGM